MVLRVSWNLTWFVHQENKLIYKIKQASDDFDNWNEPTIKIIRTNPHRIRLHTAVNPPQIEDIFAMKKEGAQLKTDRALQRFISCNNDTKSCVSFIINEIHWKHEKMFEALKTVMCKNHLKQLNSKSISTNYCTLFPYYDDLLIPKYSWDVSVKAVRSFPPEKKYISISRYTVKCDFFSKFSAAFLSWRVLEQAILSFKRGQHSYFYVFLLERTV